MSKDAAIHALSQQLGQPPPPALRELTEQQLRALARAVEDARHRQAASLQEAGDRALGRIPRLLRGPVRKAVGG